MAAACGTPTQSAWSDDEWTIVESLSLSALPRPIEAEESTHAEARALGRDLFFDKRLSKTGGLACASCHQPERYFTDGRARSAGQVELQRNTPTLLGVRHLTFFGWDGRKDSLWAQALAPLEDEREHGSTRVEVVRHVLKHYGARYQALYPEETLDHSSLCLSIPARPVAHDPKHRHHTAWSRLTKDEQTQITRSFMRVGELLAAYLDDLRPAPTPLDAYVAAVRAGDPRGGGHLSVAAVSGLKAFVGPAGCVTCHNGPLLTDREFHNLGLPPNIGVSDSDLGRRHGARLVKSDEFRCVPGPGDTEVNRCDELRFLDPEFPIFIGAFKTPTLRNVEHTGPYMHDGQFETLEAVVEFYRTLPGSARSGARDSLLQRLPRAIRTAEIVEFLQSLTGPPPN